MVQDDNNLPVPLPLVVEHVTSTDEEEKEEDKLDGEIKDTGRSYDLHNYNRDLDNRRPDHFWVFVLYLKEIYKIDVSSRCVKKKKKKCSHGMIVWLKECGGRASMSHDCFDIGSIIQVYQDHNIKIPESVLECAIKSRVNLSKETRGIPKGVKCTCKREKCMCMKYVTYGPVKT